MLIKAENIHKTYKTGAKSLHVLKGIDLSIEEGRISVIIGPSGAGKSTLLHIIGTLDSPTKGRVLFDDTDVYAAQESRRCLMRNKRIGFVFQFYHLLPEFNAVENVLMPALLRNPGNEAKSCFESDAKGLLELVGLGRRLRHRPSELSGGEVQRVAIARALINKPEIVLCDEPTGNLDSENSEIILKLIRDLNRDKKQTFLIVTHNEKLAGIADTTIHIKDGLLQ